MLYVPVGHILRGMFEVRPPRMDNEKPIVLAIQDPLDDRKHLSKAPGKMLSVGEMEA